ncbi:hypothetical protein M0R72_01075 [Candidatus Pacearchaeota archaeon]|jgi:hypothetical protein|nr:hypothetical protein [Candidatus Pacearchaeota archaeon]
MKQAVVLVIFEGVPDENKVALIPSAELSPELRGAFDLLDGKMVNGDFDLSAEVNRKACGLMCEEIYNGPIAKYFVERGTTLPERDIQVERIYRLGQYL